jgi:hypothetical protein
MSIFRTNDPTQFDAVDQIVVDESAPPSSVKGVSTNIAMLIGQFERGPLDIQEIGSIAQFNELYGKTSFSGNKVLKNKKFGRLRILRAVAAAASKATHSFMDVTPVAAISFTAKYLGLYGNAISVQISVGTAGGMKYTIKDNSPNAVIASEIYDNLAIAAITPATFAGSQLVDVAVLSTAAEPVVMAATMLSGGTDGTIADLDYSTAIDKAAVEHSCNVLFLDSYNTAKNGFLKLHAAATQDKQVIVCGPETQTVADVKTDVVSYRDTDGRIIYAYPYLENSLDGTLQMVPPASFYASVISQTSPHIDPAAAQNAQFLQGVTSLKYKNLTRADYIQLKDAGISAFEFDPDLGFKIKSGITTQILDTSKISILRRRMADYLTDSMAQFLKNYQNGVNSAAKRSEVKGQILDFIQRQELAGILPTDKEVKSGKAKIVDTEILNTDASIALGFFKILYRQRIFSSMRYIVLQAEIGESVVVTEAQA